MNYASESFKIENFKNLPEGSIVKYIYNGKEYTGRFVRLGHTYTGRLRVWAYWEGKEYPTHIDIRHISFIENRKKMVDIKDEEFEGLFI